MRIWQQSGASGERGRHQHRSHWGRAGWPTAPIPALDEALSDARPRCMSGGAESGPWNQASRGQRGSRGREARAARARRWTGRVPPVPLILQGSASRSHQLRVQGKALCSHDRSNPRRHATGVRHPHAQLAVFPRGVLQVDSLDCAVCELYPRSRASSSARGRSRAEAPRWTSSYATSHSLA